jgi:hypothetical protein
MSFEFLKVQKFLEEHSLAELIAKHGVYPSLSKDKKKLSLNYDMIETASDDELSWDCRGLILVRSGCRPFDTTEDGKIDLTQIPGLSVVIGFPFKRFFNYGQGSANINLSDPKIEVLNKLDGTLIQVNCCPYKPFDWFVSTRSVPEADLLMDNQLYTFRQLFEKALTNTTNLSFEDFTKHLDHRYTYCFELTTPLNRIVCDYQDYKITLLMARSLEDYQEIDFNHPIMQKLKGIVPFVESFAFTSIEELLTWVSTLNPLNYEGIVLKDSNFNRIKVKNAQYVALHKLNDRLGSSFRNCLELILNESDDDAIPFLPKEIVDSLLQIKEKYKNWLINEQSMYLQIFNEAKDICSDKKTFALTINKYKDSNPYSAAYFSIFDNKAESVKDFISKNKKLGTYPDAFLDKILNYLGYK